MFLAVVYNIVGPSCEYAISTQGCGLETMLDVKHANLQDYSRLLVHFHLGKVDSRWPRGPLCFLHYSFSFRDMYFRARYSLKVEGQWSLSMLHITSSRMLIVYSNINIILSFNLDYLEGHYVFIRHPRVRGINSRMWVEDLARLETCKSSGL